MKIALALASCLVTLACQSLGPVGQPAGDRAPAAALSPVRWPATLRIIGNGYLSTRDPCRKLGETPAVNRYLVHNERLLGCPTRADAERLGGAIVGQEGGITLVSVRAPGS